MGQPDASSTAAQFLIGLRLQQARLQARITPQQVATAQVCSRSTLSRMEAGQTLAKAPVIRDLGRVYGMPQETVEALVALASSAKKGRISEVYGENVIPSWFGMYVGLESVSVGITMWAPDAVPGPLQTPAYAREILSLDGRLGPDVIEQRVQVRLERQARALDRPEPADLHAVIDEAVFLRDFPPQVMEEQVRHLRVRAASTNVAIRVLPMATHTERPSGPFTVLDIQRDTGLRVGYIEHPLGAQYVERPVQLAELEYLYQQVSGASIRMEEFSR